MQTLPDRSPADASLAAVPDSVQPARDAVMALVDDPAMETLAQFERALWTALLALGRALVAQFLARRSARPRASSYRWAEASWQITRTHSSTLATRFGRVPWTRPAARRVGGTDWDFPVDRALGVSGGASFGTMVLLAHLCARMAFAPARAVFAKTHEWRPSQDMTLRIVDAVGGAARPFLVSRPRPEGDGEILVIQVDGRGAPMISPAEAARRRKPKRKAKDRKGSAREARRTHRRLHPRPRRKPGQKSKNARVVIVGVIYTLKRTEDGWEGPVNKRVYATFGGHEALFVWLLAEAKKRGYGRKRTIFLADGADAIWRRQQRFFPKAEACLDWCHVEEKLWLAGTALHREGSPALAAWVSAQTDRLRAGQVTAVIRELRAARKAIAKTGPGNKGRRERLKKIAGHLHKRRAQLRYRALLAEGLDIGTGAVEGAVRNVVALRLDGPGMRWGLERAERVLHLRCILVSDLWDDFEQHLDGQPALRLAPQPMPATPYAAKPRIAA